MTRKFHPVKRTAAALVALVFAALPLMTVGTAETVLPNINVDVFTDRADISPYIVSANHRFNSNGYGMFDAENGVVYEDFVKKTAEVNYGAIRYPAGTIGNLFKWKDSIGDPATRRPVVLANTSRASEVPLYGLDEHMAYVAQIGANATIMVAEASETPQDAADLVEYLNAPNDGSNPGGGTDWAAVRAANGHPDPYGVKYFEIGNEMSNVEQHYWLDYKSVEGENKKPRVKYALGDTVTVKNEPARIYGTWVENASTGEANQEFYSQYAPVQKGSQTIYVIDKDNNKSLWTEVSSFEGQSATAKVYMFDPETGKITFGDGVHGMIPDKGTRIRMDYIHVHAGFAEYYDAMKAIDPSIKVVSCMDDVFDYLTDKSKCDGVVVHNYPTSPAGKDARGLHDGYMKKADDLINAFVNDDAKLKQSAGRNDVLLATTEYGIIGINTVFSSGDNLEKDEARMLSRGLHFATVLIGAAQIEKELLIHQGFTAFSFGGGAGLGSAGNVYNSLYAQDPNDPSITIESAMALAYKMFGNGHGEIALNSFVENNPIIDSPDHDDYNALRVLASRDEDGTVYLFVVNRDPENDVTASVALKGYKITGDAAISTLNGESIASCNTPDHPNDVAITKTTQALGKNNASFTYSFPAHSVVTIRLTGEKSVSPWQTVGTKETFETTAIDSLPTAFVKQNQTAGVALDPADSGNRCLAISRTTGSGKASVKATFTVQKGVTRISFRVRSTSDTSRMNMQVRAGNATVLNLAIDNGMFMCNTVRRSWCSANEWHTIEFLLDDNAKEYMMYVDGAYSNSARTYNNKTSSALNSIVFDVENTDSTFYVDDFLVEQLSETIAFVGMKGDVTLDGAIGADDLTALARQVGGIELLSGDAFRAGCILGGEQPGADDLTKLARFVGGIDTEL